MITLKLYGTFKILCGKHHKINLKSCSIKDILSYILSNFPITKRFIHLESKDLLAIIINGISINTKDLKTLRVFSGDDVKLLLVTAGRGKNWQTIVGVILIIVGYILYEFGGELLVQWGISMVSAGQVAAAGYAMMVAGAGLLISGLMASQIGPSNYDNQLKDIALKKSYGWGGSALNLTKSGNPVPLGYGTMRVGSQVISGGLRAENI